MRRVTVDVDRSTVLDFAPQNVGFLACLTDGQVVDERSAVPKLAEAPFLGTDSAP